MKKIIVLLSFVCATIAFAAGDGFLSKDELPNSLAILPPPPVMTPMAGSNVSYPAFAEDQEISKSIFIEKTFFNGEQISQTRLDQAVSDADTEVETFVNAFIDPLDIPNKQSIKQLLINNPDLIKKVTYDGKNSTEAAKNAYARERPYSFYNEAVCTGDPDPHHSYPSAHSTRGMVVAYTIADLLPSQYRAQILVRGMDYGDSRVICGAHWRSDIQAGRTMANAVYSMLKTNDSFNNEFNRMKQQIDALI
ncbi:acid phosphatase [Francisella salimarina]|uniref:Acid phosphatase n=1 Tax=Francisella salimarina TaxID=2599927 RepID=A0AAJ4NPC8_9GAMM|nr:phosphatase PAP2 family protein [Francisella salimarina]QWU99452.1 phosphatase PAP2 family protein [Francisella salimarina]